MSTLFTLDYWVDDNWYVGRLKEVPGVFSQGETLKELEDNIREAYALIMEDEFQPSVGVHQTKRCRMLETMWVESSR